MRLSFTIRRFNPETDSQPRAESYRLDVGRGTTVLDALLRIRQEQDGSLALRYSCRSAICGSCAMDINGSEKLACRTSVRKEWERHGAVAVAPLRNLPVIKDLVVDMSSFWGKVRGITPHWSTMNGDVVLPKEALTHLKVAEGDTLTLTETSDGLRLTPANREFERSMATFASLNRRYRNALKELAK